MRIAIIVSVVAHVIVLLFAPADFKSPEPELASVPAPAPREITPELIDELLVPMDVQLVVALEPAATPALDPATLEPPARRRAPVSRDRIASSSRSGELDPRGPPGPPGTPTEPGKRSPLMTMRRGEPRQPLLGMSGDFMEKMLRDAKPIEIPDVPGRRIDAEIASIQERMRDGRGKDHYDPTGDRAALVALREQRKQVELVEQKDGTYVTEKKTFVAKVERDGTVKLRDKPNLQIEGLGARFDVTDLAMRLQNIDPYAAAKLRFLDRTRDQRVAIGNEFRREQLSRSGQFMYANLERLWASTKDVAARKQGLFELWDEIAETGEPELVAGGVEARTLLVRFVQTRLAERYTPAELATLNAKRTSKAVFAPYE